MGGGGRVWKGAQRLRCARRDRGRGETGSWAQLSGPPFAKGHSSRPFPRPFTLGRDIARQHHGCSHIHTSGRARVHTSDCAHVYTSDRPHVVHLLFTDTLPGSVMAEMSGTTTSMPVKQALSPGLADSTAWWRMMTSMVRGRLPAGTWEEGGGGGHRGWRKGRSDQAARVQRCVCRGRDSTHVCAQHFHTYFLGFQAPKTPGPCSPPRSSPGP